MTIWETCYKTLKENNIDVYPPASKLGHCTKEYVVLKHDGSSQYQNTSSVQDQYSILMYVPQNQYQNLDKLQSKIEKIFKDKLYPMMMPMGTIGSDYYDDAIKGHLRTLLYRNNVKK